MRGARTKGEQERHGCVGGWPEERQRHGPVLEHVQVAWREERGDKRTPIKGAGTRGVNKQDTAAWEVGCKPEERQRHGPVLEHVQVAWRGGGGSDKAVGRSRHEGVNRRDTAAWEVVCKPEERQRHGPILVLSCGTRLILWYCSITPSPLLPMTMMITPSLCTLRAISRSREYPSSSLSCSLSRKLPSPEVAVPPLPGPLSACAVCL